MHLKDLLGGPLAADLVLLVLPLELAVLSLRPGARRGSARLLDRILALAPGAFLTLALRAALLKGPSFEVAGFLLLALPAHLADVVRRRL